MIVLSNGSGDAVMFKLLRCGDLAMRIAIILSSPRIPGVSLNPDMLRCWILDDLASRSSLKWICSGHSPLTELHGIFRTCDPILINLLSVSYLRVCLGMDIVCQNFARVRTDRILLFTAPNSHLSLKLRYSQIFTISSLGRSSIVVSGI